MTPFPHLTPARRSRLSGVAAILVATTILAPLTPGQADAQDLQVLRSRHYEVHHALPEREARYYADHMDRVFDEFHKRFASTGLAAQRRERFPLYLFPEREAYESFLSQRGVSAANSGGIFAYRERFQGLATFTRGRPVTEVRAVLQHEGFHQFAFKYIGPDLPIWVNEGIAQYFEDGILVGGQLRFNLANADRLRSVRAALDSGEAIPFERMLAMTSGEWLRSLSLNPRLGGLYYDQAWSMVFFLITGDEGRYRQAFEQYLVAVGRGGDSRESFFKAFGVNSYEPFERAWIRWARQVEPDQLNLTVGRLAFLGRAMLRLQEQDIAMPRTVAGLRQTMQRHRIRMTRDRNGVQQVFDAMDDDLYRFHLASGATRLFEMHPPEQPGLPPRISAPGMRPEPTLVWYRDPTNALVPDIVWR